jgi:hypothetical protein
MPDILLCPLIMVTSPKISQTGKKRGKVLRGFEGYGSSASALIVRMHDTALSIRYSPLSIGHVHSMLNRVS